MKDGTASHTARSVAAHRLEYERVAADYGDPAADQSLTVDVADGQQPNPGRMHEYLRARTAFFDRAVVNALDRGVQQVVIGGAGYDGRALRYAKPGVRWFELDHPATQSDKVERVARLSLDRGHIRFIAADFTADPIAEPLLAAGLDPARPTLFLLEGVAVYLERPVVERVLAAFRQVAADGSELAMSVSTGTATPQERARFQQRVADLGEPPDPSSPPTRPATSSRRSAGSRPAPGPPAGRGPAARPRPRPGPRSAQSGGSLGPAPAAHSPRAGDDRLPDRIGCRLVRPPAVGAAVGGARRLHHRGRQRGRAPPTAPHHQRGTVARRDGRRALAHLAADVGQLPAPPARRGNHGRRASPPGEDRHQPGRHAPLALRQLRARPGPGQAPGARRDCQPHRGRPPRPRSLAGRDRADRGPLADPLRRRRDRGLRAALAGLVARLDPALPDCLPILGYGLRSTFDPEAPDAQHERPTRKYVTALPLWALLSRPLLAFALEYERAPGPSLAISANVLRVIAAGRRPHPRHPRPGRDLQGGGGDGGRPAGQERSGDPGPRPGGGRFKVTRLTAAGAAARDAYPDRAAAIEAGWRARLGAGRVAALRAALEPLAAGDPPPLFAALEPYPDNWRARVKPPRVLPHYPMTLHRGGYPDGA